MERRLNRHVNVFWGLNGAGKTTILKILHAAMNNETAGLDDLPFETAEVTLRLVSNGEDVVIVRRYSKSEDEGDADDDSSDLFLTGDVTVDAPWVSQTDESSGWDSFTTSKDLNRRIVEFKFRHSYLPITRVSDSARRPASAYEHLSRGRVSTDDIFVEQVRERWRDYATRSLARIRDIQQTGLATVLAILFGGFLEDDAAPGGVTVEPGEAYNLVHSFLAEQNLPLVMARDAFADRFDSSPTHRKVVSEIQAVRRLTDEVLSPQREFQRIIDSMYAGNKHIVLPTPQTPRAGGTSPISVRVNERAIPLKSLSSGEKQLLQILLQALGAGGETVMIDEPELSMHVIWQRELVGSMRRVNDECQFLLATHSPEIMAEVPDECVFEL